MSKRQHRSQEDIRNQVRGSNSTSQKNEGKKKEKKKNKGKIILEGMDCFTSANIIRVVGRKLKKPAAAKCHIITVQSDRHTVVLERLADRRFKITSEGIKTFVTDKRGAVQEVASRIATDGLKTVSVA